MKRKFVFIIILFVLFVSLGVIITSALIKTSNDGDTNDAKNMRTLTFTDLCKDVPAYLSVDDFTNLIDKTIEQYDSYEFIEIKENPWLRHFENFRINPNEQDEPTFRNAPFDDSKAQVLTIVTSKHSISKNVTREGYVKYLEDVYRIILSKLYYSLPRDDVAFFRPFFDPSMNMDYGPSTAYVFGFDKTKYSAQGFIDDYKKTMLETGKFSEQGNCIEIDHIIYSIYDITNNKDLFPTEKQQELLDAYDTK